MALNFQARAPYVALVLAVFGLDRWTKSLILSKLDLYDAIPVIDGLFDITYVQNTGVAFSLFSSISSPAKVLLLSLFTGVAAAMVIVYSLRSPAQDRVLQTGLSLILGGALGNLYDRLTYGYVIDFLDVYVGQYRWPTFNIADSAITTGVLLLALEIIRHEAPSRA